MSLVELKVLRDEAMACTACELSKSRTNVVFGTGRVNRPPIMFIGETPGVNDDLEAAPFTGRVGEMLTELIEWMGYTRNDVYIANVLCCMPPRSRDPSMGEIEACDPFLKGQVDLIKPHVIVTLGLSATHTILDASEGMSSLRRGWYAYFDVPVKPTYHPAYLLRDRRKIADTKEDLQEVLQRLRMSEIYE